MAGLAVLLAVPFAASANLWSLLFDKELKEGSSRYNSQNVSLLETLVAEELPLGGGDIRIVDGIALSPEVGLLEPVLDLGGEIPLAGQISYYVVRDGDTISEIAEMFEVSEDTIRSANSLSKRVSIRPGDILEILPISGVKYRIKEGDTLEKIAKSHDGDVEKIKVFNGITEETQLAIGDEIIIPEGKEIVRSEKSSHARGISRSRGGGKLRKAPAGYYIRPVRGRKTQGFHGPYQAIDVGAPTGTPIVAMASGRVISICSPRYWCGGFGGKIVLAHNNDTQTLYAHMSRVIVSNGQNVKQGQVIGYVGSTGRSTGPHLHYEVRGVGRAGPIQTPILY